MALAASTLAEALLDLVATGDESEAIQRFVDAWEAYFSESTCSGAALVAGSIDTGLAAMISGLSGWNTSVPADPQPAASKIASALTTFWSTQANLATSMWITSPIVLVPPIVAPSGLSTLATTLETTFTANVEGSKSLSECVDDIATAIHGASTGATVPGSVPPASPSPIPIL